MYPRRWLIASGLGAFVLGLLLCAPARLLISALPLDAWSMSLQGASGTLLAGEAGLVTRAGPLHITWRAHPAAMLLLRVEMDWQGVMDGVQADGRVAVSPLGGRLDIHRADVVAAAISRMLAPWRAQVDQPLALRRVMLAVGFSGLVRAAEGLVSWGPGTLRVDGRTPIELPVLRGRVQREGDSVELLVDSERSPEEALSLTRYDTRSRELHVVLYQRGTDLLGQPSAAARPPETVVFEMRQAFR